MTNPADPMSPQMRQIARRMPNFTINARTIQLSRQFMGGLTKAPRWALEFVAKWVMKAPLIPPDIRINDTVISGQDRSQIRLRIYQPRQVPPGSPALLWMHGGGYVMGTPEQDDFYVRPFIQEAGLVVVSVDYRLAPEHPFPLPLEDCYAALQWLTAAARSLGINPELIAIGGNSAGAGLAAALAQLACDRGEIHPVFQLLVYPMLDDRTSAEAAAAAKSHLVWNHASNRFGWESYLGQPCGAAIAPAGAVAARRVSLAELPPAWIGVGSNDLFHDEATTYARRLNAAGVNCELVTVPGAFHGFDLFAPEMQVVREFRQAQVSALKKALTIGPRRL